MSNTDQELTPQMLGLYLGCEISYEYEGKKIVTTVTGNGLDVFRNGVPNWLKNLKLHLRSLSDITEQEFNRWQNKVGLSPRANFEALKKGVYLPTFLELHSGFAATTYLLSRGFDLGIIPQQYVIHKTLNSKEDEQPK